MENFIPPNSESSVVNSNYHGKRKNVIAFSVLLVVIIFVIIGAYFRYLTSDMSPNNTVVLPIESLQTYTAISSMFTIQYPKDWTPYKVEGDDTSLGGVNIYPVESVVPYQEMNKLPFDWTAYVLPFNQHNGAYPVISVGGQATFDAYTNRGQYDFKNTPLYKNIQDYVKGWEMDGTFKNVKIEDTTIGGEPALVVTFEDSSKKSKVFYMIKLAKDAITEKLPMTAYFIVQYIAPKDQYSDEIANTLLTSFQDDLAGASARSMATYDQNNQEPTATPSATSKGNTWQVLFVGDQFSHEVNWLEFDYKFTDPKDAQGLLTVQWDAKRIGDIDGRIQRQGHQTFIAPVGKVYKNMFPLGFRLDSFTKIPSSISIGNIGLYYLDPTKPGTKTKVADISPNHVPSEKSPPKESSGTLTLVKTLDTPSMVLQSKVVKIGQAININVKEFPYSGYTYISLNQPDKRSNTIWVGLVPSNNVISFVLEDKTCPAPHPISSCSVPLIDLAPGKYILEVNKPGDDINLTSDFEVVSQ